MSIQPIMRYSKSPPNVMDPYDYWMLTVAERDQFGAWMAEHIGEPLEPAMVITCTLGEGFIVVERFKLQHGRPFVGTDGEAQRYTQTIPSALPPPVWKT
jgi:hypothetical protein